jgi:hypothetical protein
VRAPDADGVRRLRAEEIGGKAEHGEVRLCASGVPVQKVGPIKVRRQCLKDGGHVAQPERTGEPVTESMLAEASEFVFCAKDADPEISQGHRARAL